MTESLAQHLRWKEKYFVSGKLVFRTPFHIGSGREGVTGSDFGVLLSSDGKPVLPGSTLKGKFRSDCEKIAHLLGLRSCFLLQVDPDNLPAELDKCVSNTKYWSRLPEELRKSSGFERYQQLGLSGGKGAKICDICQLFGSTAWGSRVFFEDGQLEHWAGTLERRDGVVIDRDSETAVDKFKFDYEVVPASTSFRVRFEVENPSNDELCLITAVLLEWEEGVRLGKGTSRGIGLAELQDIEVHKVDFQNAESWLNWLLKKEPSENAYPELTKALEQRFASQ